MNKYWSIILLQFQKEHILTPTKYESKITIFPKMKIIDTSQETKKKKILQKKNFGTENFAFVEAGWHELECSFKRWR